MKNKGIYLHYCNKESSIPPPPSRLKLSGTGNYYRIRPTIKLRMISYFCDVGKQTLNVPQSALLKEKLAIFCSIEEEEAHLTEQNHKDSLEPSR